MTSDLVIKCITNLVEGSKLPPNGVTSFMNDPLLGKPKTMLKHCVVMILKNFQQSSDHFSTKATLRHTNIVTLVGVSTADGPYCSVLEHSLHGDLYNYLRQLSRVTMPSSPPPGIYFSNEHFEILRVDINLEYGNLESF